MSGCRDRKFTCGTIVSDSCVRYGGMIPDYSELDTSCDISVREIVEELATKQEEIVDSIDLSSLGKNCLGCIDYNQEGEKLKVREALLGIENKLCELSKDKGGSNTGGVPVDLSTLDLKCLVDDCNKEVRSLNELLQLLIDKTCSNASRIDDLEIEVKLIKNRL